MTVLTPSARAVIESDRPAHLVTLNPDGSPHVTLAWVGLEDDEIVIGSLRRFRKLRNIERDPRVAFVVDDQVAGEYLTLYGEAVIVADERVAGLTWPLLLGYMPPAEATARWERINADGSRVVIVLRPASVTGRQQVR